MKYLAASIAIALLTCLSQIRGSTVLVLACLGAYMIFLALSCSYDFTLPVLLFFLPWSSVLRTDPTTFSFYTLGMMMICFMGAVKKRFSFRNYQLIAGIVLVFLSLAAKLLHGSGLSFDYISFMMMIVMFPLVKDEMRTKKYDFYQIVVFFALGIILASICALIFADSANIRRFIKVDSWGEVVIRRSGFYKDANFYTAHVLAAFGGALTLILREVKRSRLIFLFCLLLLLLYCGLISGSKSFVLVAACLLVLWVAAVARTRSRTGLKITILISLIMAVIYVATSVMFSDLIAVFLTRFSSTKNLDTFTTGRIELWGVYLNEIFGDIKIFFLGQGFTDVKVNGWGSHNTIIQMLFQFGMLGAPVLWYWIISYFRSGVVRRTDKSFALHRLILLTGTFLPWAAIDILFADEFFLLQWYMVAAMQQFSIPEQTTDQTIGLHGG